MRSEYASQMNEIQPHRARPSGHCAAPRSSVSRKADVSFFDLPEASIHAADSTQSTHLREFNESADAIEENYA